MRSVKFIKFGQSLKSSASAIAALAALGAISGCGGEDAATDTTAPTVQISASATSVEGGETVALTVSSIDATDGNIIATLACSSGKLTGNLLVTPVVAADTPIECTATATDKAGNTTATKTTITTRVSQSTLVVPEGLQALQGGQIGLLQATNLPLDASYAATLGSTPITLKRSAAGVLAYGLPTDAPTGKQTLTVKIGARTFAYEIDVAAAPTVADPKAAVLRAFTDARAGFVSLITAATGAERTYLEGKRDELTRAIDGINGFTATELAQTAVILRANGMIAADGQLSFDLGGQRSQAFNAGICQANAVLFGVSAAKMAVATAALAVSPWVIVSNPIIGTAMTAAVLIIANRHLQRLKTEWPAAYESCVQEADFEITDVLPTFSSQGLVGGQRPMTIRALAVAPKFGFRNKVAKTLVFRRTMRIDNSVMGRIQGSISLVSQGIASFPLLPSGATAFLATLVTEKDEAIPASSLSLGSISDSRLSGGGGAQGPGLSLTFTAGTGITQNTDFSFTVNRAGEKPIPVNAQLTVMLPEAEDAALTVIQGRPGASSVTVRAADTLEMVQAPRIGSVALQNNGSFVYTPTGQLFGPDSFVYRARNVEGASRNATVLVTVDRDFTGSWVLTSRTVTRQESQPGLCPNEESGQTIVIAKSSDTQYLTNISGVAFPLSMGSKDDPAGLSGSASATYADGPGNMGSTTEEFTARIPDSNTLSATGTFAYTGSNSSSCSGVTTVTGRRP